MEDFEVIVRVYDFDYLQNHFGRTSIAKIKEKNIGRRDFLLRIATELIT